MHLEKSSFSTQRKGGVQFMHAKTFLLDLWCKCSFVPLHVAHAGNNTQAVASCKNQWAPMTKCPTPCFPYFVHAYVCVFTLECDKCAFVSIHALCSLFQMLVLLGLAFIRPRTPQPFWQESTFREVGGGVWRGGRPNVQNTQINRAGGLQLCKCLSNGRQASCGESRGGSDLQKPLCNASQLYIRPQHDQKTRGSLWAFHIWVTRYALTMELCFC